MSALALSHLKNYLKKYLKIIVEILPPTYIFEGFKYIRTETVLQYC